MKTKWFSELQAHGGTRYRLFKRNTDFEVWNQTPYFIDSAPNSAHFTMGEKYGLFGSGMGELIHVAVVPYRIAACFGGFSKLSEAKKVAMQLFTAEA